MGGALFYTGECNMTTGHRARSAGATHHDDAQQITADPMSMTLDIKRAVNTAVAAYASGSALPIKVKLESVSVPAIPPRDQQRVLDKLIGLADFGEILLVKATSLGELSFSHHEHLRGVKREDVGSVLKGLRDRLGNDTPSPDKPTGLELVKGAIDAANRESVQRG